MSVTHTQLPADHKAAIRQMKQALRAQLGDVEAVFAEVSRRIEARVAEVEALRARGEPVWPELDYQALAAGQVGEAERAAIRRRGCLVIRGHFARERALAWDRDMLDYLDLNRFDELYRGPGDSFFGSLAASRPGSIPSTGHGPRWRRARATRWRPCSRS